MDKIAQNPLFQLAGWTAIFGGLLIFIAVLRWSKSVFVAFLALMGVIGAGTFVFIAGNQNWLVPEGDFKNGLQSIQASVAPSVEKLFLQLAGQGDHRQKKRKPATPIPKVRASDLIVASSEGDIGKVRTLLTKGVDPNTRDSSGMSALEVAAQSGHVEIAKVLVLFGAEVNAKGLLGATPLMLAAGRGHLEIVKLLVASGADVHAKSDIGNTALKMAEISKHAAVIEFLKSTSANP